MEALEDEIDGQPSIGSGCVLARRDGRRARSRPAPRRPRRPPRRLPRGGTGSEPIPGRHCRAPDAVRYRHRRPRRRSPRGRSACSQCHRSDRLRHNICTARSGDQGSMQGAIFVPDCAHESRLRCQREAGWRPGCPPTPDGACGQRPCANRAGQRPIGRSVRRRRHLRRAQSRRSARCQPGSLLDVM
jgi:hypothetical protein